MTLGKSQWIHKLGQLSRGMEKRSLMAEIRRNTLI